MSHITWDFTRAVTGGAFLVTLCMLMPNVAQAGCSVYAKDPYATRIAVTNAMLRTHYLCKGPIGERDVFTETWVQGEGKHKSGPLKFKACG